MTGKELAKAEWPERNFRYGNVNRQNRNQIGMGLSGWQDTFHPGCKRYLQTDGSGCLAVSQRKAGKAMALGRR